jgi:hypothetical protein
MSDRPQIKDKSPPGLVFDNPQDNGKVEKDKDQML